MARLICSTAVVKTRICSLVISSLAAGFEANSKVEIWFSERKLEQSIAIRNWARRYHSNGVATKSRRGIRLSSENISQAGRSTRRRKVGLWNAQCASKLAPIIGSVRGANVVNMPVCGSREDMLI